MSDETTKQALSGVNTESNATGSTESLPDGVLAIISLSKPIVDNNGNNVSELTITEPTTADYVQLGDPWSMSLKDGEQSIKQDMAVSFKYLSNCTGIQTALLQALSMKDARQAVQVIGNFLGDQ